MGVAERVAAVPVAQQPATQVTPLA
jgi:hypothetical protein